jgi:hypothetical protein
MTGDRGMMLLEPVGAPNEVVPRGGGVVVGPRGEGGPDFSLNFFPSAPFALGSTRMDSTHWLQAFGTLYNPSTCNM